MKALRFNRFGDPSVLELVHRGDGPPTPHLDEVIVEVRAASINPSDVKNVAGFMQHTTLPRTPGRDFAGIVVEGPSEMIGQEVWGAGGDLGFIRDGSHAEYIAIPTIAAKIKPHNLSFVEAAAAGVAFVTAWHGLIDILKLTVGETVLITGANGSVGNAAVQIGRWMGLRTIGIDRSHHEDAAETHRPDICLTLDDDIHGRIREITEGRGVHCVFDSVGAPVFSRCLVTLANGGRYLLASNTGTEQNVDFNVASFYRRRLTISGIDTLQLSVIDGSTILEHLRPGFEMGKLHPPAIARTVSLQEARTAYHLQGWAGKTVIVMSDESEDVHF